MIWKEGWPHPGEVEKGYGGRVLKGGQGCVDLDDGEHAVAKSGESMMRIAVVAVRGVERRGGGSSIADANRKMEKLLRKMGNLSHSVKRSMIEIEISF